MTTPAPSLLVEDLAFAYPDGHQALYGVDLRIERGERVHLAMLSRGFTGRLPTGPVAVVGARSWLTALSLPLAAGLVLGTSSLLA